MSRPPRLKLTRRRLTFVAYQTLGWMRLNVGEKKF